MAPGSNCLCCGNYRSGAPASLQTVRLVAEGSPKHTLGRWMDRVRKATGQADDGSVDALLGGPFKWRFNNRFYYATAAKSLGNL